MTPSRGAVSAEPGSIERTLWVVPLAQAVLDRRVVLIGALPTTSTRATTDRRISTSRRRASGGRTDLDGIDSTDSIALTDEVSVEVISLADLIADRLMPRMPRT